MVQPIRIRAGSSKPMLDPRYDPHFAQSPIIEKVIWGQASLGEAAQQLNHYEESW